MHFPASHRSSQALDLQMVCCILTQGQGYMNANGAHRTSDLPIEILSPGDLGIATDVEEDGKTPEENAEIK